MIDAKKKYNVPEVIDALERPRLFSLLDKNRQKRVFLITGQAAQGKSTLIASYFSLSENKLSRDQTIWLHLDKTQSDHIKLFDYIFNAFANTFGDNEYFKNLKNSQATLGVGKDIIRYSEILIDLFNTIDKKINIVMDDLEVLEGKSSDLSSLFLIQNIIKDIPANISLFLLSRQMPCFSIEKMKMEKKIFVVNNEDLRFTLDETKEFFQRFKNNKTLDLKKIKKIQAATEGWAGGLTLVLESMRKTPDLTNLPDHIAKNAFSFFSEEIYSSLPDSTKKFLMKTSLFELIDPRVLADFCRDIPDYILILNQLEKRNLFIQRVDSSGLWPVYRYNKIFKTFLKKKLLRQISLDEYRKLNIEAGMIFFEKKEYEESVHYFIEGRDNAHISKIIKIVGTDFVIRGRFADLNTWIKNLPDELIWKDPWLIFYLTMTRRIKGGEQNIKDFKIALSLFEKNNDIRGAILCIAYLIEANVFMRKPFHIISTWIEKGENLLKSIDFDMWFVWARTLLWQQIGFGYIAGNGYILKGISACRNAVVLSAKINNGVLKLNASIVMVLGYVQAGDFTNAEMILSKIKNLTKEGIHPEYRVLKNLVNIDFAMKKGEFEKCRDLLIKAESDIEKFGFLFLYPGFIEAKSMYYIYTQNYKDAEKTLEHLSDFSILEGNDFYKGIAHGIKAVNLYHQEKYDAGEEQALKALSIMEKTQRSDIHLFWIKQILGFILLHQGKFDRAEHYLYLCFDYFKKILLDFSHTETSFALGLVLWEKNEKKKAEQYIASGIKKAAREKYLHFNVMSLKDFTRAVVLAQPCDDHENFADYIVHVLSSRLFQYIPCEIKKILSENKKADPGRFKKIYKLALPKLKINTLGGFHIFKNDKLVENLNWEGVKPQLLLKAIVFHGGKEIPKDVLIEDIWPESNTKTGNKNFKINLHRLRKALEPNVDQNFGYSYIIHKSSLISFDADLVTIDIDEFLKYCLKADQKLKNNQIKDAVLFYDKAVQLYKGDYFIEDPYVEWLIAKRNRLKMKFIEILEKKALAHKTLKQNNMAGKTWEKILGIDPLFERAYQELMKIYSGSGRKNKALNMYKECKNIFKKELDISPDNKTIQIYNHLRSNDY